jgi:hypothetical protein
MGKVMVLRSAFAVEHGLSLVDVQRFARWGIRRVTFLTNECNGEPKHPRSSSLDKGENAELWGEDAEVLARRMSALAEKWGFTVDYGVGMYPNLVRGKSYVHFPWD